jgi:hypothetical protein
MDNLKQVDILIKLINSGCRIWVENEKIEVEGPEVPDVINLITELRQNREAVLAFLKEQESRPPSLEAPSPTSISARSPQASPAWKEWTRRWEEAARRKGPAPSARKAKTKSQPSAPCQYDWAPDRRGQLLSCVTHPHLPGSASVWVGRDTLADMLKLGVLTGQALEDAVGFRSKEGL